MNPLQFEYCLMEWICAAAEAVIAFRLYPELYGQTWCRSNVLTPDQLVRPVYQKQQDQEDECMESFAVPPTSGRQTSRCTNSYTAYDFPQFVNGNSEPEKQYYRKYNPKSTIFQVEVPQIPALRSALLTDAPLSISYKWTVTICSYIFIPRFDSFFNSVCLNSQNCHLTAQPGKLGSKEPIFCTGRGDGVGYRQFLWSDKPRDACGNLSNLQQLDRSCFSGSCAAWTQFPIEQWSFEFVPSLTENPQGRLEMRAFSTALKRIIALLHFLPAHSVLLSLQKDCLIKNCLNGGVISPFIEIYVKASWDDDVFLGKPFIGLSNRSLIGFTSNREGSNSVRVWLNRQTGSSDIHLTRSNTSETGCGGDRIFSGDSRMCSGLLKRCCGNKSHSFLGFNAKNENSLGVISVDSENFRSSSVTRRDHRRSPLSVRAEIPLRFSSTSRFRDFRTVDFPISLECLLCSAGTPAQPILKGSFYSHLHAQRLQRLMQMISGGPPSPSSDDSRMISGSDQAGFTDFFTNTEVVCVVQTQLGCLTCTCSTDETFMSAADEWRMGLTARVRKACGAVSIPRGDLKLVKNGRKANLGPLSESMRKICMNERMGDAFEDVGMQCCLIDYDVNNFASVGHICQDSSCAPPSIFQIGTGGVQGPDPMYADADWAYGEVFQELRTDRMQTGKGEIGGSGESSILDNTDEGIMGEHDGCISRIRERKMEYPVGSEGGFGVKAWLWTLGKTQVLRQHASFLDSRLRAVLGVGKNLSLFAPDVLMGTRTLFPSQSNSNPESPKNLTHTTMHLAGVHSRDEKPNSWRHVHASIGGMSYDISESEAGSSLDSARKATNSYVSYLTGSKHHKIRVSTSTNCPSNMPFCAPPEYSGRKLHSTFGSAFPRPSYDISELFDASNECGDDDPLADFMYPEYHSGLYSRCQAFGSPKTYDKPGINVQCCVLKNRYHMENAFHCPSQRPEKCLAPTLFCIPVSGPEADIFDVTKQNRKQSIRNNVTDDFMANQPTCDESTCYGSACEVVKNSCVSSCKIHWKGAGGELACALQDFMERWNCPSIGGVKWGRDDGHACTEGFDLNSAFEDDLCMRNPLRSKSNRPNESSRQGPVTDECDFMDLGSCDENESDIDSPKAEDFLEADGQFAANLVCNVVALCMLKLVDFARGKEADIGVRMGGNTKCAQDTKHNNEATEEVGDIRRRLLIDLAYEAAARCALQEEQRSWAALIEEDALCSFALVQGLKEPNEEHLADGHSEKLMPSTGWSQYFTQTFIDGCVSKIYRNNVPSSLAEAEGSTCEADLYAQCIHEDQKDGQTTFRCFCEDSAASDDPEEWAEHAHLTAAVDTFSQCMKQFEKTFEWALDVSDITDGANTIYTSKRPEVISDNPAGIKKIVLVDCGLDNSLLNKHNYKDLRFGGSGFVDVTCQSDEGIGSASTGDITGENAHESGDDEIKLSTYDSWKKTLRRSNRHVELVNRMGGDSLTKDKVLVGAHGGLLGDESLSNNEANNLTGYRDFIRRGVFLTNDDNMLTNNDNKKKNQRFLTSDQILLAYDCFVTKGESLVNGECVDMQQKKELLKNNLICVKQKSENMDFEDGIMRYGADLGVTDIWGQEGLRVFLRKTILDTQKEIESLPFAGTAVLPE